MVFNLQNTVALVTGGAMGIGLEVVKILLQNRVKGVAIVDVNEVVGEEAVAELTVIYGEDKVIFIKADVMDKSQFEDAFKKIVSNFGNIDILVNNAGIMNDKIWEKEIDINVKGAVNGTLLAMETYIRNYKSKSEGVILNIASVIGISSFSSFPIYTATKYAVVGLGQSLGDDYHYNRTKVKILTLCPGGTDTTFHRNLKGRTLGPEYEQLLNEHYGNYPIQKPEDVAKAVIKMIKKADTGSLWVVDDSKVSEVINFNVDLKMKAIC